METRNLPQPNILFKASLSNGETIYEGKGDYIIIPNEKSPWLRLDEYITTNDLNITSLALYTKDGRTYNLPSAGKNPKLKILEQVEKPIDYWLGRTVGYNKTGDGDSEMTDFYTHIEAIYPTYSLQLWVNEVNPDHCWTFVVSK